MSPEKWRAIEREWNASRNGFSLLEHLSKVWRSELEVLEIISEGHSVGICKTPVYEERQHLDAEAAMLLSHGFRILHNESDKRLITGGPVIGPDLKRYLGNSAKAFRWVLVPPVRDRQEADVLVHDPLPLPSESAIGRWLKDLIDGLRSTGAKDIHFETEEAVLSIRTHTATGMSTVGKWEDGRSQIVLRLLCRWADLADWDHSSFLDGSLSLPGVRANGHLRLSVLPTVNGSSAVLRAPTQGISTYDLHDLGLPGKLILALQDSIKHDNGMILCSGSTGSGKTTTLYGILKELGNDDLKILTIEDPVEQLIPHAVQSSLDPESGWTFDAAVRCFLRQDPDVIMIGEIRDAQSAEAACRASLTGHCVLSTLHAASIDDCMERFIAWGFSRNLLAEVIQLIIHQRFPYARNPPAEHPDFNWSVPTDLAKPFQLDGIGNR